MRDGSDGKRQESERGEKRREGCGGEKSAGRNVSWQREKSFVILLTQSIRMLGAQTHTSTSTCTHTHTGFCKDIQTEAIRPWRKEVADSRAQYT